MNYKGGVKAYFHNLPRLRWFYLAAFVIYCIWFMIRNYPCEDYRLTIPLVLAFAILIPFLLLIENLYVIIGLNFGAIYGALFFRSSYVVLVPSSQIHEDYAIEMIIDLS